MSLYITDDNGKLHKLAGAGGIETSGGESSITADSELSLTSTNPVQNKVITTAINGLEGFVLWENPNPTASFSSQTITLNSADYDYLELYYRYDTTHKIVSTMKTVKGYECRMFMMAGTSSGVEVYYRDLTRRGDNLFFISNCFKAVATTESETTANIIPIKIVGYKG